MLSEMLASLREVKSQLQHQLARQPEFRALLILEKAALQISEALARVESTPSAAQEASAPDSSPGMSSDQETGAFSNDPADDAQDIGIGADSVAHPKDLAAVAADAPFDRSDRSDRPRPPLKDEDAEDRVVGTTAAPVVVSWLNALYDARAASGSEPVEDRRADAPVPDRISQGEPAARELTLVDLRDAGADALIPATAPSGFAAAFYESTGDAIDTAHFEDAEDAPRPQNALEEPAVAATEAFEHVFAEVAPAEGHAAATPPPRTYLPFIVAPRSARTAQR